ncbi:MAG: hypothetical protein WCJ06_19220 [Planctomycetota bacterium]
MTIAGMESPIISDKEELITKRITKKARLNGSLSASDSGLDVNPHMPPSMATFLNSIKQTNFEKTTSSQSSATPEQTIHPSMTVDLQASVVKRGITPTALAMVLDMENMIGAAGCRVFLDEMIQESGNPFDPVEIMLLEQFGYVPLVFDSNTSLVQKG